MERKISNMSNTNPTTNWDKQMAKQGKDFRATCKKLMISGLQKINETVVTIIEYNHLCTYMTWISITVNQNSIYQIKNKKVQKDYFKYYYCLYLLNVNAGTVVDGIVNLGMGFFVDTVVVRMVDDGFSVFFFLWLHW